MKSRIKEFSLANVVDNTSTQYANFLQSNKGFVTKERSLNEFLNIYPNETAERAIYEEIFKKFNDYNGKIDKVTTTTKKGDLGGYWVEGDMEKPNETIERGLGIPKKEIPEPKTMAHEVVHASDHQIDGMTPKIWEHLGQLRKKHNSDKDFTDDLLNLQGKIQKGFFNTNSYNMATSVKEDTVNQLNRFDEEVTKQGTRYGNDAKWSDLLPSMQNHVSHQFQNTHKILPKSNPFFKGQYASEFPAYALTNLTKSWKTAEGKDAVSPEGREFMRNTLDIMAEAYPAKDINDSDAYPTTNEYIKRRKNSIDETLKVAVMDPKGTLTKTKVASASIKYIT